MLVLCLTWGLQQVALKAAAADISPLMQIALRSGISAALVGLVMVWRRERINLGDGTLLPGLFAGSLFAFEFLLVGEGLRHTSASHMVVFLYTAPIFVALGLHFRMPAERLAPLQWAGIAMAFGGIAVTFLGRESAAASAPGNILFGDLLALLSGMAWGATTVVVRVTCLSRAPATQTLLYQLIIGFLLLTPAAAILGQASIRPSALALGSLFFQAVVVSFASYLVWFWLLQRYLASRLGVFSFMTPLFGVAFGVWLLGEPMENSFIAGALLVITGVVVVSGHGWLKQARRAR